MTESKGFFRRTLDAMIEARSRQAAQQVAYYREAYRHNHNGDLFDNAN